MDVVYIEKVTDTDPPVTVRLLHVPDCPLTDRVRTALREAVHRTGVQVSVEYCEGSYPSPTLLVNDTDVVTGHGPGPDTCCRLDTPRWDQIAVALLQAATRSPSEIPTPSGENGGTR